MAGLILFGLFLYLSVVNVHAATLATSASPEPEEGADFFYGLASVACIAVNQDIPRNWYEDSNGQTDKVLFSQLELTMGKRYPQLLSLSERDQKWVVLKYLTYMSYFIHKPRDTIAIACSSENIRTCQKEMKYNSNYKYQHNDPKTFEKVIHMYDFINAESQDICSARHAFTKTSTGEGNVHPVLSRVATAVPSIDENVKLANWFPFGCHRSVELWYYAFTGKHLHDAQPDSSSPEIQVGVNFFILNVVLNESKEQLGHSSLILRTDIDGGTDKNKSAGDDCYLIQSFGHRDVRVANKPLTKQSCKDMQRLIIAIVSSENDSSINLSKIYSNFFGVTVPDETMTLLQKVILHNEPFETNFITLRKLFQASLYKLQEIKPDTVDIRSIIRDIETNDMSRIMKESQSETLSRVDVLKQEGNVFFRGKDYENSILKYVNGLKELEEIDCSISGDTDETCLVLQQMRITLHLNLGKALFKLKKFSEVEKQVSSVLIIDSTNSMALALQKKVLTEQYKLKRTKRVMDGIQSLSKRIKAIKETETHLRLRPEKK